MKVTGKIKLINETQTFGNNFNKRELVVTTDEQYPQHILIEFTQDKCTLLDKFQVGQNVEVSINLRGREWINPEGVVKYFNSIQGWRITNSDSQSFTPTPEKPDLTEEEPDDLPF